MLRGLMVAAVIGGLVFILSLLTIWRWQRVAIGILGWFRWLLHPISSLLALAVRWRERISVGILGRIWRPLPVLHLRWLGVACPVYCGAIGICGSECRDCA